MEQVTGYTKFRYFSETVIGEESLEMPRLSLETVALWVELPDRNDVGATTTIRWISMQH
jgi:hypothetical protein